MGTYERTSKISLISYKSLETQMKISREQFALMSLIFISSLILVIVNYLIGISIAGYLTAQEQSKDLPYYENIEKINELLINTVTLKTVSEKNIQIYSTIPIFFSLALIPMIILLVLIKRMHSDYKKIIDSVIPKWKITEHSKILIPATIGIFVAVSLSYFSSLSYISLIRKQTIINTISLSLDTKQIEILNNLLITYIQNNLVEYWLTVSGFLYFLFALIFPIMGSVWYYYRKKELNLRIIILFTGAAFTIPFWIVMSML
jgi:hypothetical protein